MVNLDYLYNPAAAKKHFTENHFVDKKPDFDIVENGMILPHKRLPAAVESKQRIWGAGGIIDSMGEYIKSSFVNAGAGEAYTPPPDSVQYSNETVIYLGMFYPVWGHVLTDNIRRIWFLSSELFRSEFKNCPLVYIPWGKKTIESQKNFSRLLEILGVNVKEVRAITQPTRFEKIILPDESFYQNGVRVFTAEYRETIDRLKNFALKNRTPTPCKKIYYFYGRNQVGEERLAEYFHSKGYETVSPEKLTLDEQLNLLINTESFVSTAGSCSMNSVFLRNGTEVIFIPRANLRYGGYQQAIDQVYPMNTNWVDSSLSVFYVPQRNYCFIISEQLKKFFGDKFNGYEEDDFKVFLRYVKECNINGFVARSEQLKGYGEVFTDFMAQLKQSEDLITTYNMPKNWEKFQPSLVYQTHIHTKGWITWQNEEQISGSTVDKLNIQAIKINYPNHKVYYSVYYNDKEGWSSEVSNGEQAGTTGKRKPITGIKIRLDEAGAKEFDILYRVHKFDGTWTDWAKNGEAIYSDGQKLNAVQIKLETKT